MHRRIRSAAIGFAALAVGIGVSAPATAAPPGAEYVQLGDSYSAGNGAGTYTERTCWRSPANYGARVAAAQGADYVNVACSGGVVADILQPRALGQSTTGTATYALPGRAPNAEQHWLRQSEQADLCGEPAQEDWYWERTVTTSSIAGSGRERTMTATVRCDLMAAPQVDAVTEDTDAVFLTIGGNDIGFTTIVTQCMVFRSPAGCQQAIDSAGERIPQLREETAEALAAVHERSGGQADVYLLGYPFLLNTDSYGIPEAAPTYDAGAALHELQLLGDQAQAEGVAELDATLRGPGEVSFVDVKPAWGGHAHGLDPRSTPDNSDAWLVPVLAPERALPEWVHPTADGYAASADALLAAID